MSLYCFVLFSAATVIDIFFQFGLKLKMITITICDTMYFLFVAGVKSCA